MRHRTSGWLPWGIGIALTACTCTNPPPADAWVDAVEPTADAAFGPPRQAWLNPSPPNCAQRLAPPRWRVSADPGPVGSVRWVRSLGERPFREWVRAVGLRLQRRDIAPSLTGDGIASWIFVHADGTNDMIGLNHADGSWGHYGIVDRNDWPRMWAPDAYLTSAGGGRRTMFPPQPPDYYWAVPPIETWNVDQMFGPEFTPAPTYGEQGAWSPSTGDVIISGFRSSDGLMEGVGAGCVEGNRWFTELPGLHRPTLMSFVRPDGDVIVTSSNKVWVLDGETGEPLRMAIVGDVFANSASYHPGCGVLVELPTETSTSWFWLNDDTMEHGQPLRLPADRPTSIGGWAGTPDCGLVASAGTGNLVRLNADGSVRFNTPIPAGFITLGAPPAGLADGGTLVMTDPPGWIRFNGVGEITSTVHLDMANVGLRITTDTVLAPDGTMYFMTQSGTEIRFAAASTGAIPGPYLWPHSGLNWARTNSILPD